MRQFATLREDRGPNFVMRENVQRRIVVQSNVASRDRRSVVTDIKERVGRQVLLPQGYHIEYGGQFENEAQTSRQLLWLLLGVVVAIFFILSTAFGSARDAALIMVNLPLALLGVVVGVFVRAAELDPAEHGCGAHPVRSIRASLRGAGGRLLPGGRVVDAIRRS